LTTFNLSGGEKLEAKLAELAQRVSRPFAVRVGFLEDATYPDGTPVAKVAAINNFGAPGAGVPARPFFTQMIAEKSPEWGKILAGLLVSSDYDPEKALGLMGLGIANQLRESIEAMDAPPNAQSTNLLKQRFPMGGYGFDDVLQAFADVAAGMTAAPGKPLVWTGLMLNSVDFEVVGDNGQ
jgi:hypothetical protein